MTIPGKIYSLLIWVKRKFFKPRILRSIISEGTSAPRIPAHLSGSKTAQPVVYRLGAAGNPDEAAKKLEHLFCKQYAELITGRKVLIKFNLNTANPYPASVCPRMLRTLADILLNLGAREVTAGDCCTIGLLPTRSQVKKAGLARALKDRAKVICFDETPWVNVPIPGRYLESITVPRPALEADCIVALSNLKTHQYAAYTGALKLSVGFMHPLERIPLHRDHLQEKIAEINLALQPDLCVMDARTVMITDGPDYGRTAAGNLILVGENPLAIDLEAYRLLYRLKEKNNCLKGFSEDPFSLTQLRHARDIGVGGEPWNGYQTVDWAGAYNNPTAEV